MLKQVDSIFELLKERDVKVVLLDLDDTVYPECDYVMSCFREVASYVEEHYGVCNAYEKMKALFDKDTSMVFNRLLDNECIPYERNAIEYLLKIYKNHKPDISISSSVRELLETLRGQGYRLGVVTDGNPIQQNNKIDALGMRAFAEKIIVTDELGGVGYRKPNPIAFEMMRDFFGVDYTQMLYVGDNPRKDFAVRAIYPIVTLHVKNEKAGFYRDQEYAKNVFSDYVLCGGLR